MEAELDALRGEEPFSPEADSKELGAVLRNESLRRALGEILRESDAKDRLSATNLRTAEGLNEALERKGEAAGLLRAIEYLFELGAKHGRADEPNSESDSEPSA